MRKPRTSTIATTVAPEGTSNEYRRVARGATNPPRGLTTSELTKMPREEVRLLVTALLIERGQRVIDRSARGDHEELVVSVVPGWRTREGRVRIAFRQVTQEDLREFSKLAAQGDSSEAILIEVSDETVPLRTPKSIQLVRAPELIARLEDSAVVAWTGTTPKADREALRGIRAVDRESAAIDVLGIRALPILARNKLPPEFERETTPPDEIFEELGYRILTGIFRFRGERLGVGQRGERVPDALIESPHDSPEPFSAVVDFKSSRDGFQMDADDETRLCGYVDSQRDKLNHPNDPFVIVISSGFPGRSDRYPNRKDAIARRCCGRLVYLRVEHLVTAAVKLEADSAPTLVRERLPWNAYLSAGRPTRDIVSFSDL